MTKANMAIINAYVNSRYGDLWTAYKTPSQAKSAAWYYCKNKCREYGGEGLKVISKNTFMFTAGFTFMMDGKRYMMYITPSKDVAVEMDGLR